MLAKHFSNALQILSMILHAKAETLPKNPGFATAVVVAAELIVLDVDPIPPRSSDALDVSGYEAADVEVAETIFALVEVADVEVAIIVNLLRVC